MNLKYIKISVYIMSALIALGIPLVIIGMSRSSTPPSEQALAQDSTNYSQVAGFSSTRSSNVINLEKFGNIEIQSGEGFKCGKPQVANRIILLYCTNNVTHKQKIISIDLYNGATLGTILY